MAAALWTLTEKRPRLREMLPKYVLPPHAESEWSALIGLPMREIRAAAKQMRDKWQPKINGTGSNRLTVRGRPPKDA